MSSAGQAAAREPIASDVSVARAGVSPAAAIAHAVEMLDANPAYAELQAREVLKVLPLDARAILVIGAARRRLGDFQNAKSVLEPLARLRDQSAEIHYELGMTLARLGDRDAAIPELRRAAALEPDFAAAWLQLSEQLFLSGDKAAASAAFDGHVRAAVRDPDFLAALAALNDDKVLEAEQRLRAYLRAHPGDIGATRLMGEILSRMSRYDEAEHILAHCVRVAPNFVAARHNYAVVLYEQNKPDEAIAQLNLLLELAPEEHRYLALLAATYVLRTDYSLATPIYEQLTAAHPDASKLWTNYGQSLRIVGQQARAIAALRHAIAVDPSAGEAYWSLADLKTGALGDAEITAMTAQVESATLPIDEQVTFHYALGKAFEDRQDWAASFDHYAEGARIRRRRLPYEADGHTAWIDTLKQTFTQEFFAARQGWGHPDKAPIFILGLPRSGSTLLEQILSSHSTIEATMELPHVLHLSSGLERNGGKAAYANALQALDARRTAELGAEYVEASTKYRKLGRPQFIDKMPGNFFHIGLIRLMLPHAKIIDMRRDPMSACFSIFKQHFFRGQNYSYDLADIGRYYRDYVALMAHYENVLPGAVHRVHYDELVDDSEAEIRKLMAYLGLEFEKTCLTFWRNDRPVSTHSSEQVRRPIYRDGLAQWRRYESWLAPLKASLGVAADGWKTKYGGPVSGSPEHLQGKQ